MTAGIAIASWKDVDEPTLIVAADTRVSRGGELLNDSSIKTLSIAPQTAMVFSGPTTPAFVAAEMVRTIVDAHMPQPGSERIGFFDIARLVCHFQHQAARNAGSIGETILVGFFRSGAPGLARIVVGDQGGRLAFFKCERGATISLATGVAPARELLLRGLEAAKREGKKLTMSAINMLVYMARHEGNPFSSVGGQVSFGGCTSKDGTFQWLALEIDGRRFWRGIDVTDSWNPTWSPPTLIEYDEDWCSRVDRESRPLPSPGEGAQPVEKVPFLDIESVPPDQLFRLHLDPLGY